MLPSSLQRQFTVV
jgi:hypothetical protein